MTAEKPKFDPPWWLDGDCACGDCCQTYTLDLAYYCVDCDEPICPFCVVVVEARRAVCPACAESAQQHGGDTEH